MKEDWTFVVITGITVIAILLTVPIAVDAAQSSLDWNIVGSWGFRITDPIFCPINFTNIGTATVNLQQISFQIDENPEKKGLQPLTFPLTINLVPNEFVVIEFPIEDVNGDPIPLKKTILVSVTSEEVEDSPRSGDEPKRTKTVSNKAIKP